MPMLIPRCHITIGQLEFSYVHELEITSSWQELTDTATIRLPRNLRLQGKDIRQFIRAGDEVEIRLGYHPDMASEFTGYVTEIEPGAPMEITCEDLMWKLKQSNHKIAWSVASLDQVLKGILPPGVPFKAEAIELGSLRITDASAARVLAKIKEIYGLPVFFQDGTLYVGGPYSLGDLGTVDYHFQKNVVGTSLKFVEARNVRIKVQATSILSTNEKITVTVGDDDGEQRSLHFYNLGKEELKRSAEKELERLRYDGYRGSFQSFGSPLARHGMRARLLDGTFPERAGSYFIDKVVTTFGLGGFRREITLGPSTT